MIFKNRREAGIELANSLTLYQDDPQTVVLALPRGGVPVAYEVATRLGLPLDIFLVKKLGTPGQPELAMGAITSAGRPILNRDIIQGLRISDAAIEQEILAQRSLLETQEKRLRGDRPRLSVKDRRILLVDDGLATGASMRAAIAALREEKPQEITVVVPVGSQETADALAQIAEHVVCLETPEPLFSVGQWYEDFDQVSEEEVRELLKSAALRTGAAA